jgi:hypothetical protein
VAYGSLSAGTPPQEFTSGQVTGGGGFNGSGGTGGNYESAGATGGGGTYEYLISSGGKGGGYTITSSPTYGGSPGTGGYAIDGYSALRGFTNSGIVGATQG